MATPRNVRVFVGTTEIDPSETTPLGAGVELIEKPAVTIKLADGTWAEFKNTKDAHKEDIPKSRTSMRHRAAVGPGGVLQVVLTTNTTWNGDTNIGLDPDTHAQVVVERETFHEISRTFAPAAWREVEGKLGEWLSEDYDEKPQTRALTKKDGQ